MKLKKKLKMKLDLIVCTGLNIVLSIMTIYVIFTYNYLTLPLAIKDSWYAFLYVSDSLSLISYILLVSKAISLISSLSATYGIFMVNYYYNYY